MARSKHPGRIKSFGFQADPATDTPRRISTHRAAELVAAYLADWLTADSIQLRAPIGTVLTNKIQRELGWMPPFGRYRSTALNEGRCGQFTIGYPIPPVFKGHITMPSAMIINAQPPQDDANGTC